MPVLQVFFILVVVGIGLTLMNSKVPSNILSAGWKTVINWVVGGLVAWWLIFVVFGVNMGTFGFVPRAQH